VNSATHGKGDRHTIVYVVLDNGANSRVKALGRLSGAGVEFVYVSSRDVNVAPVPNLVVKPLPNPFGVLRTLGFHRLKRALDAVVYFPTRHRLYVVPVVNRLKSLIAADLARGKHVVVLTCTPPHALCVVGQKLKAKFPQIRWVIDWQDLWSYDAVYFDAVFSPYRARVKRLEHDLVLQSDLNVTTNGFAKRAVVDLHCVEPDKVTVINHHFDRRAVRTVSGQGPSGARRIVFMGGMFKPPKVPGGKFLEALKAVRSRGVNVELHLYGRQGYEFEKYRENAAEYGLIYHGYVPRAEVPDELLKYDYQLLLLEDLPNSKLIMHLKLPEYLDAGVPIVAIVPTGSAVEEIVQRTGTGHVIAADSDWVQGLGALLQSPANITRNEAEIARFDWSRVAADWRQALNLPASTPSATPKVA
jgi:glycosyltransferase involved in cell wall biosynthesis